MSSLKKIIKYIFIFFGLIILIWLSYGFYLYINLPDIEIKDKNIKISTDRLRDKKDLSNSIDLKVMANVFMPESKRFHNNKEYEFLFSQLFASGVMIFENFLNSKYSLCFDDFKYFIPLNTNPISTSQTPGNFIGFEYSTNEIRRSPFGGTSYHINKESFVRDKYKELTKQDNFPYTMKLVKGKSCDKNILEEYIISIGKEDLIDNSNDYYPFPVHSREINIQITRK